MEYLLEKLTTTMISRSLQIGNLDKLTYSLDANNNIAMLKMKSDRFDGPNKFLFVMNLQRQKCSVWKHASSKLAIIFILYQNFKESQEKEVGHK